MSGKVTHRLKYTCSACSKVLPLERTESESTLAYEQKALAFEAAHRARCSAAATFSVHCEVVG